MKTKLLVGGVVAVVLAAAAASALAFTGSSTDARKAALRKLSNPGVPVDVGSLAASSKQLFDARQGRSLRSLGTRGGEGFLTVGRAQGPDCLAISNSVSGPRILSVLSCPTDAFPSAGHAVYDLSTFAVGNAVFLRKLEGFASDGVIQIRALDAAGNIVATTPVTANLYASAAISDVPVSAIVGIDASGNVVYKQTVS